VSWDEPYDPMMFITLPGRKSKFPMWLASEIRLKVQELSKRGKIVTPFIPHWIGVDDKGNYRGISWVKIADGLGVSAETGMKKKLFTVSETELLSEILCFQIMERIEGVLESREQPVDYESIISRLKWYAEQLREASFASDRSENPRGKLT
jgi:hypothetical protein